MPHTQEDIEAIIEGYYIIRDIAFHLSIVFLFPAIAAFLGFLIGDVIMIILELAED